MLTHSIVAKNSVLIGFLDIEADAVVPSGHEKTTLSCNAGAPDNEVKAQWNVDIDPTQMVRVRVLRRLKMEQTKQDVTIDKTQWSYRTWDKLGQKLLSMSDSGHMEGDNMWRVFKFFDTGGAGTIDPQEFLSGLQHFKIQPPSKTQSHGLFKLCNLSRTGEVTYGEFQQWLRGSRGCISVAAEIAYDKDREFSMLWNKYCSDLDHRVAEKQRLDMEKQDQLAALRTRRRGGKGGVRGSPKRGRMGSLSPQRISPDLRPGEG